VADALDEDGVVRRRIQDRAVGEEVADDRIQLDERKGEAQVGEDLGEGQQARSGVEAEAVALVGGQLAAGPLGSLVHLDLVAGGSQADRGGQTADAGADDDDPAHRARPRQVRRDCRRRVKERTVSQAKRTIDTGWARASGHTREPVACAVTARPVTPSR
jgi:hypothetical protein